MIENLTTVPNLTELFYQFFPFTPTNGQKLLFEELAMFLNSRQKRSVFLLKGYAGTGKTTIIGALQKVVYHIDYKTLLLAPTGRAAKIMSLYAQRKAFTIHKTIYRYEDDPKMPYALRFQRQNNHNKQTLYIVDEASMIDDATEKNYSLLSDLIEYIFQDETAENKLLLVGDTAQLPPVHQTISPALDAHKLRHNYQLHVTEFELTEVLRQAQNSGILQNATIIRESIQKNKRTFQLKTKPFKDIYRMTNDKLEDGLRYGYKKYGVENTIIICRSNRSATQYNHYIRRQIHFYESELEAGDILMIVRNNYFWLPYDSPAGFLANGEFVEVVGVHHIGEEMFGYRFADLVLRMVDYPEQPPFEAKVFLDTLHSYQPNLTFEDHKKLLENAQKYYLEREEDKKNIPQRIREDKYLNALQVKFAYALTCHKSQGGQWDAVFVELGYQRNQELDIETLRWLYTAMTRATKELFLVNFPIEFFAK